MKWGIVILLMFTGICGGATKYVVDMSTRQERLSASVTYVSTSINDIKNAMGLQLRPQPNVPAVAQ